MKYIGLFSRPNEKYNLFNKELCDIILKYQYTPLAIIVDYTNNPNNEFERIIEQINLCDGFILQGGNDYYDVDILITKYLHKENKVTLGICLGMQQMGMAFNGIMDDTINHQSKDKYVHNVNIVKNTKLYNIINQELILVNSRHNSYIVKTDLNVNATNNIIEGIEDSNKDFFIGLQWHPESIMDEFSQKIFDNFFYHVKKQKNVIFF